MVFSSNRLSEDLIIKYYVDIINEEPQQPPPPIPTLAGRITGVQQRFWIINYKM